MYQRNIFDYATFIPCEEDNEPFIIGSKHLINNHGHTPTLSDGELKATLKDYYKFKLVYKDYFNIHRKSGSSLQDNDDTSSIKTKSSSFSTRFGSQFMKLTNPKEFGEIDLEPSWWLETATSPISWREYIWSAFSWFASAGSVESSYKNGEDECEENREGINEDDDNVSSGSSDELKKNFIELVEIIGNFHKLTKKWFYLINEVVSDVLDVELIEGTSQSLLSGNVHQLEKKIKIELTYQDIIDMELDPYSHEDLEFVKQFVLLYWNETVESVEIGLGLSGICC